MGAFSTVLIIERARQVSARTAGWQASAWVGKMRDRCEADLSNQ